MKWGQKNKWWLKSLDNGLITTKKLQVDLTDPYNYVVNINLINMFNNQTHIKLF